MAYHNGVPITVVSGLQSMLTSTESASRRRAEEDARVEECNAYKVRNNIGVRRRSAG